MPKIKPITALRNANELEKEISESSEPIFITKNGNLDFIMLNEQTYKNLLNQKESDSSCSENHISLHSLSKPKENKIYSNTKFYQNQNNENMGFVKVGCATYKVEIGNVRTNVELIKKEVDNALKNDVNILVFPELCLTGYTCNDIFYYPHLLDEVVNALKELEEYSYNKDIFFVIGAPIAYNSCLFNCWFSIYNGSIQGIIPKKYLPNYGECY